MNCIIWNLFVPLPQQIPPRFPLEQRTRAELRFIKVWIIQRKHLTIRKFCNN